MGKRRRGLGEDLFLRVMITGSKVVSFVILNFKDFDSRGTILLLLLLRYVIDTISFFFSFFICKSTWKIKQFLKVED